VASKRKLTKKPIPIKDLGRPEEPGKLTGRLEYDCKNLKDSIQAADLKYRQVRTADGRMAAVFYYSNLVDVELISQNIITPLQQCELEHDAELVGLRLIGIPEYTLECDYYKIGCSLAEGAVALVLEGIDKAILANVLSVERRPIGRAEQEDVLVGPHESFSESLGQNVALIRRRLATPALKVKSFTLGRESRTKIAVLYIEGIVQEKLVAEMEQRLSRVDIDSVGGSTMLADFLSDEPTSLFPTLKYTERPSRVVAGLLEGRIAMLADGDPNALIAPTFAPEFLQSSEDYFDRPIPASFARFIRFGGLIIAVFFPALWISLVSFHHGIIPPSLFQSIVAGREGVPLPTVLEIFVLLLAFDLIVEASTRMPSRIGQALGIVGGIILGQAAVQAGLVSPALVIVVALTGLAVFTQPSVTFLSPLRVIKYPILILSSILGLFGLMWSIIFIIIQVTSIRSFGYPYMYPVAPFNLAGELDVFVRAPLFWHKKRPHFLAPHNEQRLTTPAPSAKQGN